MILCLHFLTILLLYEENYEGSVEGYVNTAQSVATHFPHHIPASQHITVQQNIQKGKVQDNNISIFFNHDIQYFE
jgi:hypothetical protein